MLNKIYLFKDDLKISIPLQCVVRNDDEFVSLELGINWNLHSKSCEACNVFLSELFPRNDKREFHYKNKTIEKWILKDDDNFYNLVINNFSDNSHFDNKLTYVNGVYTFCKFKIKKIKTENYISYFESLDQYELCSFLVEKQND